MSSPRSVLRRLGLELAKWLATSLVLLRDDPDESYDVSQRHPEGARRLAGLLGARMRGDAANPRGCR